MVIFLTINKTIMKWFFFLLCTLSFNIAFANLSNEAESNGLPTPTITDSKVSALIKKVKFTSKFVDADSSFINIKAKVLLPKGFSNTGQPYPLKINVGGLCQDIDRVEKQWLDTTQYKQKTFAEFHNTEALPMVTLFLDGKAVNNEEDSYWVNSSTYGKYESILLQELLPIVEKEFKCGGAPENRYLYGASTGGWVAINLFSRNEKFSGGVWAFAPDPLDFTKFQLINIYENESAFTDEFGNEIPSIRDTSNNILHTVREEVLSEQWEKSDLSKKGKQWWIWNKAFSPKDKFLFDSTGKIDKLVANYWKQNFDLAYYYRTNEDFKENEPGYNKVNGKIHLFCGKGDDYYLDRSAKEFSNLLFSLNIEHKFILDAKAGHRFMRNESKNDSIKGNYLPGTEVLINNSISGIDSFKLSVKENENIDILKFKTKDLYNGIVPVQIKTYDYSNVEEKKHLLQFTEGTATLPVDSFNNKGKLLWLKYKSTNNSFHKLYHISQKDYSIRLLDIPMWLSILPPLIAILLAFLFRQVIVSLFAGVWAGAFIAGGLRIDNAYYFILSLWNTVSVYVLETLTNSDHVSVILFSLLIGGMVAIISKNGGMAGLVNSISKHATSSRSAQSLTWLSGLVIFFDDYANTLIVGNTMRSLTDKFSVSREKLAYIVDSTAAPLAAIAFITTWVGAEVGYIADSLPNVATQKSAYSIFLMSLKYSFYPILTLFVFVPFLIFTKRDYGKMLLAERKAKLEGSGKSINLVKTENNEIEPSKKTPTKWINAVVPVAVMIFVTVVGLIITGSEGLGRDDESTIQNIMAEANSFTALIWGSLSGVITAIIMTVSQKILNLNSTIKSFSNGLKMMLSAITILILAWALADLIKLIHTSDFISSALSDSLNPYFVPMVVFAISAIISFSTGSSWSTMAIVYPLAIPIAWAICQDKGLDYNMSMEILLNVISVVLAASVFGDHCSPISDTTILSSLASDCDHNEHVKTQLPYAITVGLVALIAAGISTLFTFWWWLILVWLFAVAILITTILLLGKKQPFNNKS